MRIFKRGDTWGIDFRPPGGKRKREMVGSKQQAELALSKIRTEIFEGTYFANMQRRVGMTLQELYELWGKHAKHKASYRSDDQRMRAMIARMGCERRIESITPSEVLDLRAWLLDQDTRKATATRVSKNKPSTVNRYLTVLRTAMNLAVDNHALLESPVRRSQFLEEENRRNRICSQQEFEQLYNRTQLPHLRLAIVLGIETMMRLGEIQAMRWSRTDLSAEIVHLPKTKNGRSRDVPLSPLAIDALKTYRAHRAKDEETKKLDALFSVTMETLSSDFGDLVERLQIHDLHFHDLRHTCATRLRRAGVDVVTIKEMGGWLSWQVMQRYQTITHDDLRAAVAKLKTKPPTYDD